MISNMLLAKRSGLDLKTFWHSIRASAGNSFLWETAGPNIFRGDYHDSFALDLQCKDIQLFYEMSRNAQVLIITLPSCVPSFYHFHLGFQVPIELSATMQQIYQRALYQLGPKQGCYAPPKLLEDCLKDDLRVPGFENWSYDVENVDGALRIRHSGIDLKMEAPSDDDNSQTGSFNLGGKLKDAKIGILGLGNVGKWLKRECRC